MFKSYAQLNPDERAVKIIKLALAKVPAKNRRALRVLLNAIAHLEDREVHPDNRESVRALWSSLK